MENFIRDALEKQMQILSERSIRENGEYLAPITAQMIELAKLLAPESTENSLRHSQLSSEVDEDTIGETILDIIRILDGLSYADAKIMLDLTSKALVPTMRVKYPEDPEEAMREYYNQSGNKFA